MAFVRPYQNRHLCTLLVYYERENKKCCPIITTSSDLAFDHYIEHLHPRRENITITGGSYSRPLGEYERSHLADVYNSNMGGTDAFDQLCHKAKIECRYKLEILWRRRTILSLVKFMMCNAHIKFKSAPQNAKSNFTVFRYKLALWFLKLKSIDFLDINHSLKCKSTQSRCLLCRNKGITSKNKSTTCRASIC